MLLRDHTCTEEDSLLPHFPPGVYEPFGTAALISPTVWREHEQAKASGGQKQHVHQTAPPIIKQKEALIQNNKTVFNVEFYNAELQLNPS